MQSLPSEIRSNIVEFGSGQYPLRLSNQELIERIKQYDPTFDYNKWMNNVALKKDTLKKVLTPGLEALYDFISVNNICSMVRYVTTGIGISDIEVRHLGITIDREVVRQLLEQISKLVSNAGYKVDGIEGNHVVIPDIKQLWMKLLLLNVLRSQKRGIYNWMKLMVEHHGFDRLLSRIHVLDVPLTLAGYLQYVARRKRQLDRIMVDKLYPIYSILEKHRWNIPSNSHRVTIFYLPVPVGERVFKDIRDLLDPSITIKQTLYTHFKEPYLNIEIGPDENIASTLRIMDEFFHPYTLANTGVLC